MPRSLKDLLRVGELDDSSEIHHRDTRADLSHHGQVVRDEDVREVELRLERAEQVEDLRLNGDIQRRDRLVADDQLRIQRQSACDPDPLPLAPRELVRIAARVLGAQPDDLQELSDAESRLFFFETPPWIAKGWSTICSTDFRGLSEAYGSWKIICISRRSRAAPRLEMPVMSRPSNRMDPRGRIDEPQHEPGRRRLPAAGLADDPERLASMSPED